MTWVSWLYLGTAVGACLVPLLLPVALGIGYRSPMACPGCGATLPMPRWPTSMRQFLLGGWTCRACGCEVNRRGKKIG